jgi:hypothetical protein
MAKHIYDVTIDGVDYEVESDHPLSDREAYDAAKGQHAAEHPPTREDIAARNATAKANMAKQANAGKRDLLADFATSGPMGNMNSAMDAAGKGNYARATHQAVTGASKVLAPTVLPALAAAPVPVALALAGGAVGDPVARGVAQRVTDNPDYVDVAGDLGGLAGGIAGGTAGSAAETRVSPRAALKFVGDQLSKPESVKQMVGRAIVRAAEKPAPTPADLGVVPTADAAAARPTAVAPAGRPAYATVGPQEFSNPHAAVAGDVTSTADAASSNPDLAAALRRRLPYRQSPDQPSASAMVVPTSQTEASFPAAAMRETNGYGGAGIGDLMPPDVQGIDPGSFEVVDPDAGTAATNGSGDSAASLEAIRRELSMRASGRQFVVRRGGVERVLIGPDAVDYTPGPGEVYGVRTADGFTPLTYGQARGR